jgi:NH3-dependent NAD+ synthetase
MNHILIIKDDGTFEIREFDETDSSIRLKQLQKAVDGYIERFNPIHTAYNEMRDVLGEDFDLYANEEGLYRDDFKQNLRMCYLYPYSPIMGNVVVVGMKETDEGIESAGIERSKLERLVEWFQK